jgi:hypothetical protein
MPAGEYNNSLRLERRSESSTLRPRLQWLPSSSVPPGRGGLDCRWKPLLRRRLRATSVNKSCPKVPRPWRKSQNRASSRGFRLVKPSRSSLREVERPLGTATYEIGFLKFTPNRPPGYTFSFPSAGEGRNCQIADQELPRRPRSTRRRTATPAGSSRWENAGRGLPSGASRPPCGRRPRTRRSLRRSSGAWLGSRRGRTRRAISSSAWDGSTNPGPGWPRLRAARHPSASWPRQGRGEKVMVSGVAWRRRSISSLCGGRGTPGCGRTRCR